MSHSDSEGGPTTGLTGQKVTTTTPPPRSYHLPGGPYACGLNKPTVTVVAEIVRGGDEDRNAGR